MLETYSEDQLVRSCEERSITSSQGEKEHTIERRANWIGRILLRFSLLNHVIEGNKEE